MLINFEYHFDDETLKIILKKITNKSDVLIITHTIATPVRYLKQYLKYKLINQDNLRDHGYERSHRLLKKIAEDAGYHIVKKSYIGLYSAFMLKRRKNN